MLTGLFLLAHLCNLTSSYIIFTGPSYGTLYAPYGIQRLRTVAVMSPYGTVLREFERFLRDCHTGACVLRTVVKCLHTGASYGRCFIRDCDTGACVFRTGAERFDTGA